MLFMSINIILPDLILITLSEAFDNKQYKGFFNNIFGLAVMMLSEQMFYYFQCLMNSEIRNS